MELDESLHGREVSPLSGHPAGVRTSPRSPARKHASWTPVVPIGQPGGSANGPLPMTLASRPIVYRERQIGPGTPARIFYQSTKGSSLPADESYSHV